METRAVLRLVWPFDGILSAMVFHTAAECALSRSNRHRNCDRVTVMERHVRKTA